MSPLTTSYAPNFCPNCGCSIVNVAVAMQFAALKNNGGNGGSATNGGAKPPVAPVLKGRQPWTDEDHAILAEMRQAGKGRREIAARLNRSESSIMNAYAKSKPVKPSTKLEISKGEIERAWKFRESNLTCAQTAKAMGILPRRVKRAWQLHSRNEADLHRSAEAKTS